MSTQLTLRDRRTVTWADLKEMGAYAPEFVFEPVSGGRRVRCTVCLTMGYPGDDIRPMPWQVPHVMGHAACPKCGRMLTLKLDGKPRTHARCPEGASK